MATASSEAKPEQAVVADEPGLGGYRPYRITADVYDRLAASGVFRKDEPLFLWKGQLVAKMTKGNRHTFAFVVLTKLLSGMIPEGWFLRPKSPVRIADDGVPEPDFSVGRGRPEDFLDRTLTSDDVALVIEISDSSLRVDSGEVLREFARVGIPVYWVVNLPGRSVDVYVEPSSEADAPGYAVCQSYRAGEEIPVVLDGREVGRVRVGDVLP